eukprot:2185526-Alexandrium_andersonii.AAC.1
MLNAGVERYAVESWERKCSATMLGIARSHYQLQYEQKDNTRFEIHQIRADATNSSMVQGHK